MKLEHAEGSGALRFYRWHIRFSQSMSEELRYSAEGFMPEIAIMPKALKMTFAMRPQLTCAHK
jgi:hypothetical protein